jgi:endoglucanase
MSILSALPKKLQFIRTTVSFGVIALLVTPVVVTTGEIFGADLIRVLPVTNKILEFHFKEGHIDYNGVGATGAFECHGYFNKVFYQSLVNTASITTPSNCQISSPDDSRYASSKAPVRIGYKAVGTEFNSPLLSPQFLREYFVYAELQEAMSSGKRYTIALSDLADNKRTCTILFDEKTLRSPTIKVSQVGFPTSAPKYAYFSLWMGTLGALELGAYTAATFNLINVSTGAVVKTWNAIQLQKSKSQSDNILGNWSGADVYDLDFSDITTPGRYKIVAENIGCSFPFDINDDVYREPYRAIMRGMYGQRMGVEKYLYEYDKIYPRARHPDVSNLPSGIWGWYADAGDWDLYQRHWTIPFAPLLAYAMKPANHKDGDVGNKWREKPTDPWIEEGNNGVPDIIDEGRWMIEFGKRVTRAVGGVISSAGADGGATCNPSWADKRPQPVGGVDPVANSAYAGGAAYLAYCLNKHHTLSGKSGSHPESAAWIAEAQSALARGTSGDWRTLSMVALYLATGDASYQSLAKAAGLNYIKSDWLDFSPRRLAACMYAISAKELPNVDLTFYDGVKNGILADANLHLSSLTTGYRFGGVESRENVNINLLTIPRLFTVAVAYELTKEKKYFDCVHTTMAYLYGGNQENRTRLTGVGYNRELDAFVCDAWYLLDFNHIAYRNPIFPGFSVYNGTTFDISTGPGSESWARSSALPEWGQWPRGENRMRNRYSIAGSEFTINQNNAWYMFAAGYLLDGKGTTQPFSRPTVALNYLEASQIGVSGPFPLSVTASPTTERVEYWYDYHFIGESENKANGFLCIWDVSQTKLKIGDQVLITAIAYDYKGEPSVPTPEGEKRMTITSISALKVSGNKMRAGNKPGLSINHHLLQVNGVQGRVNLFTVDGRFITGTEVTNGSVQLDIGFAPAGAYVLRTISGTFRFSKN